MIDIGTDELIRLTDVPRLRNLPRRRNGKRLHRSTVFRWALNGVAGVRLETVRVGGALCTTVNSLNDFFRAAASPESPVVRTPKQRNREIERAEAELAAAGI